MKAVKVSDALYELAQREAGAMTRSIAQQIEHWARLGVALSAGHVTLERAVALASMGESNAARLTEELRSFAGPRGSGSTLTITSEDIARAHARLEEQVVAGTRDPRSFAVIPASLIEGARFSTNHEAFGGPSGW